jgi:hypothetical protein
MTVLYTFPTFLRRSCARSVSQSVQLTGGAHKSLAPHFLQKSKSHLADFDNESGLSHVFTSLDCSNRHTDVCET